MKTLLRLIPKRYYVVAALIALGLWTIHWAASPQRVDPRRDAGAGVTLTTASSVFDPATTTTMVDETTTTLDPSSVVCGTVQLFGATKGRLVITSGATCDEGRQVIAALVNSEPPAGWTCNRGEYGKYYTACVTSDNKKSLFVS